MHLIRILFFAVFALQNQAVRAAEPFLRPHDVIALVGGEDMVVASELGYLETLLQLALPSYQLKVRSLAWEGDTVFEQHRDLNYPTLETQLEKIGATVVIAQFGQMESLDPKSTPKEWREAYTLLIGKLSKGGTRRMAIISPVGVEGNPYRDAKQFSASSAKWHAAYNGVHVTTNALRIFREPADAAPAERYIRSRDGIHFNSNGQQAFALAVTSQLGAPGVSELAKQIFSTGRSYMRDRMFGLVTEKNRLWFHYTRPQNWAFLAGDRTNQPSSRDYKDPAKRWFPEELERFVPLIEAKEQEIWAAAAKLK